MHSRCRHHTGVCLIIFGILGLGVGIAIYIALPMGITNRVVAARTVKSPSEDQAAYDTYAASSSSVTNAFYLFNISNCEDFFAGTAQPKFVALGPYVYSTNTTKLSISFNSDNTLVSYKTFTTYSYNATLNTGTAQLSDTVCAINPAYQAALAMGDGTEDSFVLLLTPTVLNQIRDGLIPVLQGLFQTSLPATACTAGPVAYNAAPTTIPSGLDQVYIGVVSQYGTAFAPVLDSTQSTSFSAMFMAQALSQLPALSLASSQVALVAADLPSIFLDQFPTGVTFTKGAAAIATAFGSSIPTPTTDEAAAFGALSLNDYRLLMCGYGNTNNASHFGTAGVCSAQAASGVVASANLQALTASELLSIHGAISGVLNNLYTAFGVSTPEEIGAVQWLNFGVLFQPLIMPTSTPVPLRKPLELGYIVPSSALTPAQAVTILSIFYTAPSTSVATALDDAQTAGLPAAYAGYLAGFIFTEAVAFQVAATALGVADPMLSAGLNYVRQQSFFNAPGAKITGSVDISLPGGSANAQMIVTLTSTGVAAGSSGYELWLAQGDCTSSTHTVNLTSYLPSGIDLSGSTTVTFTVSVPAADIGLYLASTSYIALSGPAGDWTNAYNLVSSPAAWTGACATLNLGSLENVYNTIFSTTSPLTFLLPANLSPLAQTVPSPSAQFVTGWTTAFGSGFTATNLVKLYTGFSEQVYATLFPSTSATVLAYMPTISGSVPNYGHNFYSNLIYIQLGTAGLLPGGASLKYQPGLPAALSQLLFFPEMPIQSVNHTSITGGFTTTTPVSLKYDKMQQVIAAMTDIPTYLQYANAPSTYWNQFSFTANEITAANAYLQYAIYLTGAAAWVTKQVPSSNPLVNPPVSVAAAIASPANALNFLLDVHDSTRCAVFLGLPSAAPTPAAQLFPISQSTWVDSLLPWFTTIVLGAYNAERASYGMPAATVPYGDAQDFFYLQLGYLDGSGHSFTATVGKPATILAVAQGLILLSGSYPASIVDAAQQLFDVLNNRDLELWAAAENAIPLPGWRPFGVSLPSFTTPIANPGVTFAQIKAIYKFCTLPPTTLLGLLPAIQAGDKVTLTIAGFPEFNDTLTRSLAVPYLSYLAQTVVTETFVTQFQSTSGLFVTRTAQEWIEGYEDPLLAQASPANAVFGYAVNPSRELAAETPYPYYTYYTRGANIGLLHDYNGSAATLSWQTVQTIDLTSDGTVAPPGNFANLTAGPLNVYVSLLDRVLSLSFNGSSNVQGVPTKRFVIDTTQLTAAATPDITIDGVLPLGVLQGELHNTPLFASLPMLCYVDLTKFATVDLQNAQVNCTTNLTTSIDMEPVTGSAFSAIQQLQVNTALVASKYTRFNGFLGAYNFNTTALPAPLYYTSIYASITPTQASSWNSVIDAALKFSLAAIIIFLIGGAVFILIGSIMVHRNKDYRSASGLEEPSSSYELSKKGY